MKKILSILLAICLFVFGAQGVYAGEKNVAEEIQAGLKQQTGTEAGVFEGVTKACFDYGQCTMCDILIVLITISDYILRFFAILALIFFLWGAGYLMLSAGNEDRVKRGKEIIRATIIGTVIVLISWQLMAFIVTFLANGNVFADSDQVNQASLVSKWYEVAQKCGSNN